MWRMCIFPLLHKLLIMLLFYVNFVMEYYLIHFWYEGFPIISITNWLSAVCMGKNSDGQIVADGFFACPRVLRHKLKIWLLGTVRRFIEKKNKSRRWRLCLVKARRNPRESSIVWEVSAKRSVDKVAKARSVLRILASLWAPNKLTPQRTVFGYCTIMVNTVS